MPDDTPIPFTDAAPMASGGGPVDLQPPPSGAAPTNAPPPYTDTATAILGGQQPQGQPPMAVTPSQPTSQLPGVQQPQMTPTPRDVQHHMGWLHSVLDRVGTILGGGETAHVHKDTNGNVTVTRDPATMGEKWGRVAQAALTGLGAGLENSTGPNAAVHAGAAGIQAGMQQAQQPRQQAYEEAGAQQQLMLRQANMVKLNQDAMGIMLDNKLKNIQIGDDDAKQYQQYEDAIMSSDNAKDYGIIGSTADLQRIAKDPDFVKHHAGGQLIPLPVRGKDGTLEYHAVAVDKSALAMPAPKGMTLHTWSTDTDGVPHRSETAIPEGSRMTMGELLQANHSLDNDYAGYYSKYEEGRKNQTEADKPAPEPKTMAEALIQAYQEPDPTKRAQLLGAANQIHEYGMAQAAAGRTVQQGPPTPTQLQSWAKTLSDPRNNATLAQVPMKARDALVDYMNTNGMLIAHPLTADELKRTDLASVAIDNLKAAQEILNTHPEIFGPSGWASNKFKDAFGANNPAAHAFMQAMNQANLPLIGIHAVKGKWAADDLAKEDANIYSTPENIKAVLDIAMRSAQDIAKSGGGRTLNNAPTAPPAAAPVAAPVAPAAAAPAAAAKPVQQLPPASQFQHTSHDAQGHYKGWNGSAWVDVQPPTAGR